MKYPVRKGPDFINTCIIFRICNIHSFKIVFVVPVLKIFLRIVDICRIFAVDKYRDIVSVCKYISTVIEYIFTNYFRFLGIFVQHSLTVNFIGYAIICRSCEAYCRKQTVIFGQIYYLLICCIQ